MKNFIVILLLSLLRDGVFGDDVKKEKTEGDSLTLSTDVTKIQSNDQILWMYGPSDQIIAKIDKGDYIINDDDEIFKDNLELNRQTGSLTIKNIRIKNTGLYRLDINRGATSRKFRVTVYAHLPTPVIDSPQCSPTPEGSSSRKCVFLCSVQTLEQATLSWYKGSNLVSSKNSDICSSISLRLEANYEDKNIYSCIVNNPISNKTQHLNIAQLCQPCPGSGVSSGAVAGIVVVLLLVFLAAAAGVIYYRRKISDLERQKSAVKATEVESVSVSEGDDVTLSTDVPEIQRDDQIKWKFGGELIAEIKGETSKKYDGVLDGIFKNRLNVDQKTGSLTITNTEMRHAGVYELKIKSGIEVSFKKFIIILRQRKIVKEGESVTLDPKTEIQSDHQLLWMFEEKLIAQIKGGTGEKFDDVPGERFRDRLELEKTGSLTIKNMRNEESGLYKLQIISSRGTTYKRFFVTVCERIISVKEKESVTLDLKPKIQTDDQILWMFKEKLIARIKGGTREMFDVPGGRFRDRLELEKTGSLTIKNMRYEESGLYKLQIISSRGTTITRFFVTLDGHRKNESATVEMPLLSDVNDHLETRSL